MDIINETMKAINEEKDIAQLNINKNEFLSKLDQRIQDEYELNEDLYNEFGDINLVSKLNNKLSIFIYRDKEQDEKIKELKEKYVGKLLYIDSNDGLPICVFVNDIKESYCPNNFEFVGPHIVLEESEYYLYSNEDSPLIISQNEFDKIKVVNDMGHIAFSKKQFIKQYIYYQLLGKRVENCMNKFLEMIDDERLY